MDEDTAPGKTEPGQADGNLAGVPETVEDAAAETLADRVFFVFSGLSSVWFAIVLFQASLGWQHVWFLVVFWAALAYLVLPRLHRIFTRIYLPDYFIGRSRTSDGLLGDPVNVAFLGSAPQVHTAMSTSQWTLADPVTLASSWQIVSSTLTRRSYDEAPVSPLFLFSRQQDFAYQQEVDGNPGKRHHIRFWKAPPGWLLPGGIPVDWLAAGSYDRAVGFSLFTLQITHKIEASIDVERDYVVQSVLAAAPESSLTLIRDFSTGYHSRNGGGDSIVTDGDLPIVDLSALKAGGGPAMAQPAQKKRRPLPTLLGGIMVLGRGMSSLVLAATFMALSTDEPAMIQAFGDSVAGLDLRTVIIPGAVGLAVFAVAEFIVAWFIFRGGNRARVVAMTLGAGSIVVQFSNVLSGGDAISFNTTLVSFSLDILLILALSSERSRTFARRQTGSLRHPKPLKPVLSGNQ